MDPNVAGSNPVDRPFLHFAFLLEVFLEAWQALLLGLVQGIAEFFPVSSSAHLRIARWFLGVPEGGHLLYFDLACHGGTLLALLIYLRGELKVFRSVKNMAIFALALAPLVPAYFLLKPLRLAAQEPCYLGYFLMFTSFLLFVISRKAPLTPVPVKAGSSSNSEVQSLQSQKYRDVLFIGVMQALALIPGISRSGSTIAAARLRGWEWKEAARFSFLLSIPAILGGQFLETMKLLKQGPEALEVFPLIIGFAASFLTGLVAVRCIFWVYENEKVRPFAWYCLGMGLFAWAIFHGQTAS